MALPPGVDPLEMEGPQEAEDAQPEGPGRAKAWLRPVLAAVAAWRRPVLAAVAVTAVIFIIVRTYRMTFTPWLGLWGTPAQIINKQTFAAWEKMAATQMLANKNYGKWPVNSGPARMHKKGKRVVTVFPGEPTKEELGLVIKEWTETKWTVKEDLLPEEEAELRIIPMGSSVAEPVNFGLHADGEKVKYLSISPSGVSNVHTKVGAATLKTLGPIWKLRVDEAISPEVIEQFAGVCKELFLSRLAKWKKVHNVDLKDYEHMLNSDCDNFGTVLESVRDAFKGLKLEHLKLEHLEHLVVTFFELPTDVFLVYTSADVRQKTGAYYIRTYEAGDAGYAKLVDASDSEDFYFAWSTKKGYFASKYTMANLLYDCEPDADSTQ